MNRSMSLVAPALVGLASLALVPGAARAAQPALPPPPAATTVADAPPSGDAPAEAEEADPFGEPPAPPDFSEQPRTIEDAREGPRGAFPPPPPEGLPRLFNASAAWGPGWLALRDAIGRDGQAATGFAVRLGVVVAAETNVFVSVDRTATQRRAATFSQTAGLFGIQRFFFGRGYVAGALGLAWVAQTGVPNGITDGPGSALSAALGIEALRTQHLAFTAEVSATMGFYDREKWESGGVRLGLVVF